MEYGFGYGSKENESSRDWFDRVDKQNSIIDTMSNASESQNTSNSLSKEDKQNIARGALQGGKSGLSGALMGGGLSAVLAGSGPAGWAAMGGGLLLSELESANQAEAMQEQANIDAEINRRQNAQKAGNSLLTYFNSIGNMKA